jgi:hypothetical protein
MILLIALSLWVMLSAFFIVEQSNTIGKLQKQLDETQNGLHSNTPIKELAAEFRSFVEGIDGIVSPEVDEALKKLENTPQKALGANSWAFGGRIKPSPEMWKLIMGDIQNTNSTAEVRSIIERLGIKYVFSIEQQYDILKEITNPDCAKYRERLRDYFAKHHEV